MSRKRMERREETTMNRLKRAVYFAVMLLVAAASFPAAALPYHSYAYDAYGDAVYTPDVYAPTAVVSGQALGIGAFNEPTDITTDAQGNLYIVDEQNDRIVVLTAERQLKTIYKTFTYHGKTETLRKPGNVFVTRTGELYISDAGNKRILIVDPTGEVQAIITKPQSSLYPQEKEFSPGDLVVTSAGMLYVIVDGIYQGVVVFTPEHTFDGFFGANQVEPTFDVVVSYFWKQIATQEQKSKMARYVPVQYVSLAIDDSDFVFATVASAKGADNRLKKLNPQGKNILTGTTDLTLAFGDPEEYTYMGEVSSTLLTSVDVVSGAAITTLDRMSKKVYQYSQDGRLVTIFGGEGNHVGTFSDPVAVCSSGDGLAVLDKQKASVTFFEITEYGKVLLRALGIYTQGLYVESIDTWQEVLKYDSNSVIANLGYGKALLQLGDYAGAMEYFKKANCKSEYSAAFKEYRKELLHENYAIYVSVLAAVLILVIVVIKTKLWRKIARRRQQRKRGKNA